MKDGGIPGSDDNKEPELSQHSMLFSSAPSISSEFPHSFKEFLTNCLSDTEKGSIGLTILKSCSRFQQRLFGFYLYLMKVVFLSLTVIDQTYPIGEPDLGFHAQVNSLSS